MFFVVGCVFVWWVVLVSPFQESQTIGFVGCFGFVWFCLFWFGFFGILILVFIDSCWALETFNVELWGRGGGVAS